MRFNASLTRAIAGVLAFIACAALAAAQCPPADAFEPNDTCAAATVLPIGLTAALSVEVANRDYFRISVAPGEQVAITQSYDAQQAELAMELYDDASCTTLLTGVGWGGGSNQLFYGNGSGATRDFYVRVKVLSHLCNTYDLFVTLQPDPCLVPGLDDNLEDNDSCLNAVALTPGTYSGLFIAAPDLDYYRVDVPAGQHVLIDQVYVPGAELYIDLFSDPACNNFIGTEGWGGGSNSIAWANTTGSTATLYMAFHIDALSGSCTNYDLSITLAPDPCQDPVSDDALERNDTCLTAHTITSQLYTNLFVSKLDTDVFTFDLAPGGFANIAVHHVQNDGDIDIALYDDASATCLDGAAWIAASQTFADSETIAYSNSSGATVTYYLHVAMWDGSSHACNSYDMDVALVGDQLATLTCAGDSTFDAGAGRIHCPCGNNSGLGADEGCLNSQGHGASISATGSNFVAGDNLIVNLAQARPNQPSMLVQGAALIAFAFKDGILCMGSPTERIEVVPLDAQGSGATVGSIVTQGGITGPGIVRYYQYWYRDPAISVCGSGSNFSNALRVDWL